MSSEIKKIGNSRGYFIVSPVIAQAIIESNHGKSALARYNNFFGMKAGTTWKGKTVKFDTKEFINGKYITINDTFRAYDNAEDGIKGYYDFISTPRYKNLKTSVNYLEYCNNLKKDGYATSPVYVETLIKTIKFYGLDSLDKTIKSLKTTKPTKTKNLTQVAKDVIKGKYGTGEARKKALTKEGYDPDKVQKKVNELLQN